MIEAAPVDRTAGQATADDLPDELHVVATVNAAWNIWNFRRPIVEALLSMGHRVTVLAPKDNSISDLERIGCRFVHFPMDPKGLNPLREIGTMRRLRAQFDLLQPDVVLSYTIKNNIFGAMAARKQRIPFIPNVSGLGTAFLSGGMLRRVSEWLYRPAFRNLGTVFFQNESDLAIFVERRLVREDQARLLPGSGVDLQHFAPAQYPDPDQPPTFLMMARLLRDKGVVEFAEAARLVRQTHPQARFQLLGPVVAQNRTAIDLATVRAWETSHGVEYLGEAEDVRGHVAKAHCIVLPSFREGTSKALIEAAAMARPLIASDVPGCREVVDDGVNGFLCEARNPQSLAQACLRFLDMPPEHQDAFGKSGRAKAEREFDQAIVVKAYLGAIGDVLRKESSR